MKSLILIILLFLVFQQQYPLTKHGIPTSRGIEMYVEQNEAKFISEYENLVQDSLYDVYISVDNLSLYQDEDTNMLGYCLSTKNSSEIIITNEEKFLAYEVSMLSKYKKRNIISNSFVKGTIFHELTHCYFNQVISEMKMDSMYVCPDYYNFSILPHSVGSKFIEEGICMYVSIKIGEVIEGDKYLPKSVEEINSKSNQYNIMYLYSAEYVKSFLNYYGIKKGIQMIVSIKPPSYDEILHPSKYFDKFSSKN